MKNLAPLFVWILTLSGLQATVDYSALAQLAIARAGDNAAELQKALDLAPSEQKKGMAFLISYMPPRDLTSLKADFLLENAKWAYKARAEFPWAKTVPEDIFFNDVLPYAALNERRDNWREDFHQRFSKHVAGKTTLLEAISAVNTSIKDEVKVDYSTQRKKADQSPYESMESNKASCTGLSILLTDAFRSVGIPARISGTPAWTTKPGNHNWVEVWTSPEKQWQFTEYYPDGKGLDHGWLLADAAKANPKSRYHSIYSSSWKPADAHFPLVWDLKNTDVHAVNVSDFYIKLGRGDKNTAENICELRIEYLDHAGKRIAIPVTVTQGDAQVGKGLSPQPTDDMNRYLTLPVQRGQIYHLSWTPPGAENPQFKKIKTTPESAWLLLTLRAE